MPIYACELCSKEFKRKSGYMDHMARKRSCVTQSVITQKQTITPISLHCGVNNLQSPPPCLENETNSMTCPFCQATYSRLDNLKRHVAGRCKLRAQIEENNRNKEDLLSLLIEQLKEQNQQQMSKIDELTEIIKTQQQQIMSFHQKGRVGRKSVTNTNCNNTSNSNNTHNTTNNNGIIQNNQFNIVQFGRESSNHLSSKEKMAMLNSNQNAFLECIKMIHFNPAHPDFHNLYVSNMRSNVGMVYKDGAFTAKYIEDIVEDLVDNRLFDLQEIFKEMQPRLSDTRITRISGIIQRIREAGYNQEEELTPAQKRANKKYLDKLKKEMLLLMYNHREMIMETYKKVTGGEMMVAPCK